VSHFPDSALAGALPASSYPMVGLRQVGGRGEMFGFSPRVPSSQEVLSVAIAWCWPVILQCSSLYSSACFLNAYPPPPPLVILPTGEVWHPTPFFLLPQEFLRGDPRVSEVCRGLLLYRQPPRQLSSMANVLRSRCAISSLFS